MELNKSNARTQAFGQSAAASAITPGRGAESPADVSGFDSVLLSARTLVEAARPAADNAYPAGMTIAADVREPSGSAAVKDRAKSAFPRRLQEETTEPRHLLDALLAAVQAPMRPMQLVAAGAWGDDRSAPQDAGILRPSPAASGGDIVGGSVLAQAGAKLSSGAPDGLPIAAQMNAVLSAAGGNTAVDSALAPAGVAFPPRASDGPSLMAQTNGALKAVRGNIAAGSVLTAAGVTSSSRATDEQLMVAQPSSVLSAARGGAAGAIPAQPGAELMSRMPDAQPIMVNVSAALNAARGNAADGAAQPGAAALPNTSIASTAAAQTTALRDAVHDELPARMSALLPSSSVAEGATPLINAARQVSIAGPVTPEVVPQPVIALRPDADASPWAQQLKSALGERLQIQLKNHIQHATIRLDPPEMGKIDIALKLDGGRVQVHISASHADVYRALQQTSGELRQTLVGQHFDQVNVQVSAQSGQQQQGRGHASGEPTQAAIAVAAEIPDARDGGCRQQDDSVLLTV